MNLKMMYCGIQFYADSQGCALGFVKNLIEIIDK